MARGEDYIGSYSEIESAKEMGDYVTYLFMVDLMELEYKTGNIRSLGGLNGIRGRCGGSNKKGYISLIHKKLIFPCLLLVLFLSIEPHLLHTHGTL